MSRAIGEDDNRPPLASPATGGSHFPPSARKSRYSRAPLPSLPVPTATSSLSEMDGYGQADTIGSPSSWSMRKSIKARSSMMMFPGSPRASTVKSPRVRLSLKRSPLKKKRMSSRPSQLRASTVHSMSQQPGQEEAAVPAALSISLAWTHIAPTNALKTGLAGLTKSLAQLRTNLVTMLRGLPDKISIGGSFHGMSPRVQWGLQQVAFIQDTELLGNIQLHRLHCINSLRPVQNEQRTQIPARDLVNSRCEELCQQLSTPALRLPHDIMQGIPDTYEAISSELMQAAEPQRRADIDSMQKNNTDNFSTAFQASEVKSTPVSTSLQQPQFQETGSAGLVELRLPQVDVVQVFKDTVGLEMQAEEKMESILHSAFFPTKTIPGPQPQEDDIMQEEAIEEDSEDEEDEVATDNGVVTSTVTSPVYHASSRVSGVPNTMLRSPTIKSPAIRSPNMRSPTIKSPILGSPHTPSTRSVNTSVAQTPPILKNVKFNPLTTTSPLMQRPLWSPGRGSPRLVSPRAAFSPETPSSRRKKQRTQFFDVNSPTRSTVALYAIVLSSPPLLPTEAAQQVVQVARCVMQMPGCSLEHRKMLAGLAQNQGLSEQGTLLSRTAQQETMVRQERIFSKESVGMELKTKRQFANLRLITSAKAWVQVSPAGKPVCSLFGQQIEVEQQLSPSQQSYTSVPLHTYAGCETHVVLVAGKLGVNEQVDELVALPLTLSEEELAQQQYIKLQRVLFQKEMERVDSEDTVYASMPITAGVISTIQEGVEEHELSDRRAVPNIAQETTKMLTVTTEDQENIVAEVEMMVSTVNKGVVQTYEQDDENVSVDFLISHLNKAVTTQSYVDCETVDFDTIEPSFELYKLVPEMECLDSEEHGVAITRRPIVQHVAMKESTDVDDWGCQVEHVMQSQQQARRQVHSEILDIQEEPVFVSPAVRKRWSATGVQELEETEDNTVDVMQMDNIVRKTAIQRNIEDEDHIQVHHNVQTQSKSKQMRQIYLDDGSIQVEDVVVKQDITVVKQASEEEEDVVISQQTVPRAKTYKVVASEIGEGEEIIVEHTHLELLSEEQDHIETIDVAEGIDGAYDSILYDDDNNHNQEQEEKNMLIGNSSQGGIRGAAITPLAYRKRLRSPPRRREPVEQMVEQYSPVWSSNFYEAALEGRTLLFRFLQACSEKTRSAQTQRSDQLRLLTVQTLLPTACTASLPGALLPIPCVLTLMSDTVSQGQQFIQLTNNEQVVCFQVSLAQTLFSLDHANLSVCARNTPVELAVIAFASVSQASIWHEGLNSLSDQE